MKDEEIFRQVIEGDQKAFEILVNKYSTRLLYFTKTYNLDDDEAKDVIQESFFKAWKYRDKFNSKNKFSTWLYTITKNNIIDIKRKKHSQTFSQIDGDDFDIMDQEMDTLDSIAKEHDMQTIQNEIEKLSSNFKQVLLLHYDEELTFDEISKLLNIGINTVKSWHYRAIQTIRANCTKINI
jgi:RNA polymerase sigma-70 factor (ECF subfamily)